MLLLCKAIKISLPEGRMYVVKEGKTLKKPLVTPNAPMRCLSLGHAYILD